MFTKLGLNSYEEKIYKTLLEYGTLSAKEISEKSSVPPTAVYPNLKELEEKQLIHTIDGVTKSFAALDPKKAIPLLIEKKKSDLDEVKHNSLEQANNLFQSKQIQKEKQVLTISHGKDFSRKIYFDAIKKATKSIYILGWSMETVADKYEFLQRFKKKKGCDIRFITIGSKEKQWSIIEEYRNIGIRFRQSTMANFSLFIVDGKECKITLKDEKNPKRYNIHILDQSLSQAMHNYFLSVWKSASPLQPNL